MPDTVTMAQLIESLEEDGFYQVDAQSAELCNGNMCDYCGYKKAGPRIRLTATRNKNATQGSFTHGVVICTDRPACRKRRIARKAKEEAAKLAAQEDLLSKVVL